MKNFTQLFFVFLPNLYKASPSCGPMGGDGGPLAGKRLQTEEGKAGVAYHGDARWMGLVCAVRQMGRS